MPTETESIANLTHHQNITDALLSTMGECMAVQQALLHIPPYDGKNMPLKTFIQDVENGLAICPDGIKTAFFKGVIAKLRDTARDAVSGVEFQTIEDLKNALRAYFAPRKTYSHYCADIQAIRMRRGETIMEYYARIKRFMESARASLKEKFTNEQVPHMITMLDGIALESFKRGLSDDFLYALSVQEPKTLEEAVKVSRRIETDMAGASDRKGQLHILEATPTRTNDDYKIVKFQDSPTSHAPWRTNQTDGPKIYNNADDQAPRISRRDFYNRPNENKGNFEPRRGFDSRGRFPGNNFSSRSNFEAPGVQQVYRNRSNERIDFRGRSPTPTRFSQPISYPYPPGIPFSPPVHYMYPYMPPYYPQYPMYNAPPQNTQPQPSNNKSGPLNSPSARRQDAPSSNNTQSRQATVKFISAEELIQNQQDDQQDPL